MLKLARLFRNITFGFVSIPVDFALRLVTKKAKGPEAAVLYLGIILLFLDLAILLPVGILSGKYPIVGTIGVEAIARLNIATIQYVMLLPLGAFAYQVYLFVLKGFRLDMGLVFFILVLAPIFGSLSCASAFWVIGMMRIGALEELAAHNASLAMIAHIEGATTNSWGFFSDMLRACFPFLAEAGEARRSLLMMALNAYTAIASLWFSFEVWKRYHGDGSEYGVDPRRAAWNPRGLSKGRRIGTLLGFVVLASLSVLCLAYAGRGYFGESRILRAGIEVEARAEAFRKEVDESPVDYVRYVYQTSSGPKTAEKRVEYPFYSLVRRGARTITVKYNPDRPDESLILYSRTYKLRPDHDNHYSSYLFALVVGLGFLFSALWCFPLMWVDFPVANSPDKPVDKAENAATKDAENAPQASPENAGKEAAQTASADLAQATARDGANEAAQGLPKTAAKDVPTQAGEAAGLEPVAKSKRPRRSRRSRST